MSVIGRYIGRLRRWRVPETNSGIPVESETGIKPLSMEEMIQRYVRSAMSSQAVEEGMESFEEADDFEEDDPDVIPMTHHQVVAMSDDEVRGVAASYGVELKESTAQERAGAPFSPPPGTLGTPQKADVPPTATQAPQAG